MDPQVKSITGQRLSAAGLMYSIRPEEFVVAQRLAFMFGLLVFLWGYFVLDLHSGTTLYVLMFFAPAGYLYPRVWLRDATKRRHHRIEKEFPFFLDLLVLVMRSGLNFASAVSHAVSKMPEGPVKSEFERVLREIRTGVPRRVALTDMKNRIDLQSVTNFVAAINQAEETGGEISNVLTVQATQRRAERFLAAEKQANQAPVKMLLPLVALLFPISMIIIMFPLFVKARDSGAFQMLFH